MAKETPSLLDRFIAVGSYLTLGTIGMLYFLINATVLKKPLGRFLAANLFQSFIISIVAAILITLGGIISDLLSGLLTLQNFQVVALLYYTVLGIKLSLGNLLLLAFLIYLSIFSLFGMLPYIPGITNMAKSIAE